jgi:hypothetical protein
MSDIAKKIGSLHEMAEQFEARARAARDAIKPHTPTMRIALLREQARIWEEAARVVRDSLTVTEV